MSEAHTYQRFLAELKRRKVFQVAALYGAGMFGVLQGADVLVPALHLPAVLITVLAISGLTGFPLVLIVAWTYERTSAGLVRTEEAESGELSEIIAAPAAKRWPVGLAAAAGTVLLAVGVWWALDSGLVGHSDYTSIAVLPFENMSGSAEDDYFSDGLSDELIGSLTAVSGLRVAGRTSSFAFKGQERDLREIGDILGVETLLEGSVRRSGGQVRITAQLIDTSDGFHVWSLDWERALTADNMFAVQDEIASAIVAAMQDSLDLPAAQADPRTANLDAYDLYLQANSLIHRRGSASLVRAIELLDRAIVIDPDFAPAYAALGDAHALRPFYDETPWDGALSNAERAARTALALDSTLVTAHIVLGNVHRDRYEWAEAETAYRRAMDYGPGDAEVYSQYGQFLEFSGRLDESLPVLARARELEPLSALTATLPGLALARLGRLEDALEMMDMALAIDSSMGLAWSGRWEVLASLDRFEEAETSARLWASRGEVWIYPPDLPLSLIPAMADLSLRPATLEYLDSLRPSLTDRLGLAWWYLWLGDEDTALELFAEFAASGLGNPSAIWWPQWDVVRDDPRFIAILETLNLPYEPENPRS